MEVHKLHIGQRIRRHSRLVKKDAFISPGAMDCEVGTGTSRRSLQHSDDVHSRADSSILNA
jgi:hypothetical protein